MKWLVSILIVIIVILVVGFAYIFSGYYNVSATQPHWASTLWIIDELRERSIEAHSKGIRPPPPTPRLTKAGLEHFHEMCHDCHGAPGYKPEEFAEGLYPKPPGLSARDVQAMSDAALFWVVKNGIKMTGMPAFGPTHGDDILWGMVSVVRQLPGLKADQYKRMLVAAGVGEKEEDHHDE
jgi:mono/diheme cytochrome c family protein